MTRDELEQVIYERTRDFVGVVHLDCILELIADEREKEREACAKVCEPQDRWDDPLTAWSIAQAIRARGQ
jgi:hypothetical protein